MKKGLLSIFCLIICTFTANAQLGGVLRQAANKAAQKAAEKAVEKATDKTVKAIEQNKTPKDAEEMQVQEALTSMADIMKQLPQLPSVQELVDFKTAELNEQALKLMTSPVTAFSTKALNLSMLALSFSTKSADSAQIMETTYKQTVTSAS